MRSNREEHNAAQKYFSSTEFGKDYAIRYLCAVLYVQARKSSADHAAVQKYADELDALLGN